MHLDTGHEVLEKKNTISSKETSMKTTGITVTRSDACITRRFESQGHSAKSQQEDTTGIQY